jgi:hypothetical protein
MKSKTESYSKSWFLSILYSYSDAYMPEEYFDAKDYYGRKYIFPYLVREQVKWQGFEIVFNGSCSLEERVEAAGHVISAYFARSIEQNGYKLDHPVFIVFVTLILRAQEDMFPKEIRSKLLEKYPFKEVHGTIPTGKSTWVRPSL